MSDRCAATITLQCQDAPGHRFTHWSDYNSEWDDGPQPQPRIEITDAMKERGVKALQSAWRMPDDAVVSRILEAALNGDSKWH